MPITLPQVDRRTFLKRAALAATAAALAPKSNAALFGLIGKSRDKHTVVFLSDTHIAADRASSHGGVVMADNFGACVQEITELHTAPAAIIVNGDLAYNNGQADDYATFGQVLRPLRSVAPVHLSLGNHDNRKNFWHAFPHDAAEDKSVPDKQITVVANEYANWFLLDSLDVTAHTPGEIGTAQLDWLDLELSTHAEKPAIVVCHHPLDITGLMGLRDSLALEQLLMRNRQVKAFIFGHTHNWNLSVHPSGVHLINLPQTAYAFQAGRPSGWVRATLAKESMEIELQCLDKHHPEHGQVKTLNWRPA